MPESMTAPKRDSVERLLTILRDAFPLHLAIVLRPEGWVCLAGGQVQDGVEIAPIAFAVEDACPHDQLRDAAAVATAMVDLNGAGETLVRYVKLHGRDVPDPAILAICRPRQAHRALDSGMLERISSLSRREAEITVRLAAGDTLADISSDLGVTIHTARNQLKSAMKKARVHSQAALVACLYHWLD
ncbi:helix-turn-helix transcriptional regulator [Sphingomonas koreensis]|nr:helix-turn-helix transcriptional regulator [Sphingomonas koreensis]